MAVKPHKQGDFAARAAARAAKRAPRSAGRGRGAVDNQGDRLRSTRYFKTIAFEILARDDLAPRDRERLLEINRMACSVFMRATVDGTLDDTLEPRATPWPATLREAIEHHAREIEKLAARSS